MRRSLFRALVYLAVAALMTFGLAACGSKSSSSKNQPPKNAKQGGALVELNESDVDNPDPGVTYEQFSLSVFSAVDRFLYNYAPPKYDKPVPDLASGPPVISPDKKTVTVKIKTGVKFSSPVNRAVTSKDVKYAIERGFTAGVPNPYASGYFGSIQGVPAKPGKYQPISGIQTPDDQTIVFKLTKPLGGLIAQALVLPITAPVPQSYAQKYDAKNPSTYPDHQVFTGPYMWANDGKGNITGRSPGKEIKMVRNPNWDKSTDFRPAYVDSIDLREGITDAVSATRKILNGKSIIEGNVVPPAQILKQIVQGGRQKDQLAYAPGGGGRYVSLNSTIKPFNNINVRKAVIAGIDRDALRLSRGGAVLGPIAQHVIPPGIDGFQQAGGNNPPPGADWLSSTTGNPAAVKKYFALAKAQGVPISSDGMHYAGKETFLMVGENSGVPAKTAQVTRAQFQKLGFKINFKGVPHDVMYEKFCNVPAQKVAICPNTGFFKDFQDAGTLLFLTFDGKQILPVSNSNWPQLKDPAIDTAIDKANEIVDPAQRAAAWAKVDQMVTLQAPVIPWIWDKTPLTRSSNVEGVPSGYSSSWDLSYMAIKG